MYLRVCCIKLLRGTKEIVTLNIIVSMAILLLMRYRKIITAKSK